MVTGSYPPDTCGVGDFTAHLVQALLKQGVDVDVVYSQRWGLRGLANVQKRITALSPDIVHMQYPTIGYGASLAPQLLSLWNRCIITIHEISQTHILRRLSLLPFSVRSHHIIFTNAYERKYALRWIPWIADRSSIVPIGSSMEIGHQNQEKDLIEVVYLAIIRPDKGLEQIIDLASLIKDRKLDVRIRVIGKPHPKYPDFFHRMYQQSKNLPILWNLDLPDKTVVDLLARSQAGYLPFPDGASERRSSLFALLVNGVVTVTTKGAHTPPEMDKAVGYADTPQVALQLIQKIITEKGYQEQLRQGAYRFVKYYSWESIAEKHIEIYRMILNRNKVMKDNA